MCQMSHGFLVQMFPPVGQKMGLSENVVYPIFPMVLLIIIPFLNGYFIGNINPTFSDTPIYIYIYKNLVTIGINYHYISL